jgi:hypothetical protein
MNRSILIAICDFLVLSLLSLARFDEAPPASPPEPTQQTIAAGRPDKDVLDMLSLALEQEKQARALLEANLSQTRESLEGQQQQLSEREKNLQQFQSELLKKEEEARRLQAERNTFRQQFTNTQSTVESLKQQLTDTSSEARISQQRLQDLQAELARRQRESERLQAQLADVEKNRRATESEKTQLATQLQVAETEKRLARAQIDTMRSEVQVVREEKAKLQEQSTKLSQGVTELAASSKELSQEIRENRPLAPNTIFSDFIANRVQSDFQALRRGVFGREVSRDKQSKTVLITYGSRTYALFHLDDTPLTFSDPGTDWDWFTGNLRRRSTVVPVDQLSFLHADPRVILVPVSESNARALATKVYRPAQDPFKFQEAVVVGANEGYYGEVKFQLDPTQPQYVKMEHSTIKGLFGKFNPSTGDLVFTKGGDLLGIMVNKEYCAVLNNFARAGTINLGIDIGQQHVGNLLAEMRWRIDRLPLPLR